MPFSPVLNKAPKFVPRVKARDVRSCWLLRCDKHYVPQTVPMESANRREVISQRFTVAPFESLTEVFDCFADDLFGLLDFHVCSPVSGASCPLHQTARGQGPETEHGSEKIGASRLERAARLSDTAFGWRETCQWRPAACDLTRRDAPISKRQKQERDNRCET